MTEISKEIASQFTADRTLCLAGSEDAKLPELISLVQAAGELPRRRGGRKTHVATLYRWTNHGCRGVKLRFTQIGATRCTTRQWLAEFFERLTAVASGDCLPVALGNQELSRTPTARSKAAEKADRELQKLGV